MPDWSTAFCESNGIGIHYARTGGDGCPVVLLHGLTANGACWTTVARALEGEYEVVMPDARGHGKSTAPDSGYRYEDHADDVVGLIRTLGLRSPILIGHSMGGLVATVVAARHADLLRGLILVDPTFLSLERQREVRDSDVADQHRRFLRTSLDELVADARARHPHRSAELLERIARARLQTSTSAFDVLTPPNPDYAPLVRAIDVPCVLVTSDSGVVSPALAAELLRLNPRWQVENVPNAGHGIHYDQPERFVAVVKSALRRLVG